MKKSHSKIEELLINSNWEKAGEVSSLLNVDELCELLNDLSVQRKVQLFMVIPDSKQERVFKKCPTEVKVILLSLLELKFARRLLIRQSASLQNELLQKVPKGRKKSLLL